MNLTQLLDLIGEFGKPLECGLPPKIFFFRGPAGEVFITMQAFDATRKMHVPIKLSGEITEPVMRQYLTDARAALEKSFQ